MSRALKQAIECAAPGDIVFVSTDSLEIKQEAEKLGVKIPFLRSPETSSDTASTYSAILETLQNFKLIGTEFEKVVLLQPTSPFRTLSDIHGTLALWSPQVDMAVSVCEAKANPYYNLFETDADGFLKISKGSGKFSRRQDLPKVWEYNGAVYVMTVDALLKSPMSEFKKIIPYEMPRRRSLDLDTPEDWILAETLWLIQNPKL